MTFSDRRRAITEMPFLSVGGQVTGDFTGVVNQLTPVSIGAASANIVASAPANPSPGDIWGYIVEVQSTATGSFAQAPGYCIEPNNFEINNASYTKLTTGGAKWSTWIDGEWMAYQYISSGFGWRPIDGRIAHVCFLRHSGGGTWSASTHTKPAWDTPDFDEDNALIADLTNDWINVKRSGIYVCSSFGRAECDDSETNALFIIRNGVFGTSGWEVSALSESADSSTGLSLVTTFVEKFAAEDDIKFSYIHTGNNTTFNTSLWQQPRASAQEIL